MTLDRFVTLVRSYLAMHKTLDVNLIYAHAELVQGTYEQPAAQYGLPWFLFDPTFVAELPGEQATLELPGNFIAFDDEFPLRVVDTYRPLMRVPDYKLDYLVRGAPCYYSVGANILRFAPKPFETTTIVIPHYKKSLLFTLAEGSPWLQHFARLMAMETLLSLASGPTRDADAIRTAQNELAMLRPAYAAAIIQQRHTLLSVTLNSYTEE